MLPALRLWRPEPALLRRAWAWRRVREGQQGRGSQGRTRGQMSFWYAPYEPHHTPEVGTNVATLIPNPLRSKSPTRLPMPASLQP